MQVHKPEEEEYEVLAKEDQFLSYLLHTKNNKCKKLQESGNIFTRHYHI